MKASGDGSTRLQRMFLGALLAGGLSAAGGQPASAECDGPIPSFRAATTTAKRIVIGDVVSVAPGGLVEAGVDGRSSRFTLHVRYVLRGDAPAVMEIRDLSTQPCAPSLVAAEGDRLALAFDATDFTPPIQVNTAAWIRGTPPDWIGLETVTLVKAFALVGLDPPDTSTEPAPAGGVSPIIPTLLAVLTGLLALIIGARGLARRS